MTITDWIQFWLAVVTTILAIVSVVAMWITIRQNAKTNYENSRAKILFYIDYVRATDNYFLTIKNFGNSIGKVNYVKISPKLDYQKIKNYKIKKRPVLTESTNIALAPNQKVSSWFDFRDYPNKIFDVELSYTSLNDKPKTFIENYKIDLSFIDNVESLLHWSIDCPDDKTALVWIDNQLAEISERII